MGRNWTTVVVVIGALLMYLGLNAVVGPWAWVAGCLVLIGVFFKWLFFGG